MLGMVIRHMTVSCASASCASASCASASGLGASGLGAVTCFMDEEVGVVSSFKRRIT